MNASANIVHEGVAHRLEAALLRGRDPGAAMRDIVDICDSDADAPWEVLALVDQYYRRGRISDATFRLVNSQIQRFAVGGPAARAATRASLASVPVAEPAPPPPATDQLEPDAVMSMPEAVAPPPPPAPPVVQAPTPVQASPPVQSPLAAQESPAVQSPPARPFAGIAAQMFPDAGVRASAAELPLSERVGPVHRVMPAGTVLSDRYVLEGIIDHGTADTVYRAVDRYRAELPHEEQRVVVKFAAGDAESHRQFFRAQGLTHPNITRVLECGRSGDLDFHTLEFQRGKLLRDVLREMAEPMPRPYALAILRDVGAAIVYAHEHGVVHGSLDPKTVLITVDGGVSVLNFDALPAHQDPRHDLHALACIAYELFSGTRPFPGHDAVSARMSGARARRPRGLGWGPWRSLKQGLDWSAVANHPMTVKEWLAHLDLKRAAPRLPILAKLLTAKSPRRFTPLLATAAVAGLLAAAALTFDWPALAAYLRRNPQQPTPTLMRAAAAATVPAAAVAGAPVASASVASAPVASTHPAMAHPETAAGGGGAPPADGPAPVDDRPGRLGFAADSIAVPADAAAARVVVHRSRRARMATWASAGGPRMAVHVPARTTFPSAPSTSSSPTVRMP